MVNIDGGKKISITIIRKIHLQNGGGRAYVFWKRCHRRCSPENDSIFFFKTVFSRQINRDDCLLFVFWKSVTDGLLYGRMRLHAQSWTRRVDMIPRNGREKIASLCPVAVVFVKFYFEMANAVNNSVGCQTRFHSCNRLGRLLGKTTRCVL